MTLLVTCFKTMEEVGEMRNCLIDVLLMMVIASRGAAADGNAAHCGSEKLPKEPALRTELLARKQKDQQARLKLLEWAKRNGIDFGSKELEKRGRPFIEQLKAIDAENRAWLKQVIHRYGWPGRTLVGPDGAHAAWLLIQHADADRALQKRCLKLMRKAPKGEVQPENIAYLTDRIRLADGKKQLYGTQVELKDGRWQVCEVEDPDRLDHRRRQLGLPPIETYLKSVAEMYGTSSGDAKQGGANPTPDG